MEEFTHCSVCRRTPLVGEQVVVMAAGRRESPLCELCLGRPRSAALGEAVRRERIRSAAGAATVRRTPVTVPVRRPDPTPAKKPAPEPALSAVAH